MKFKIFRYRKPELLKDRGSLVGFVPEAPIDQRLTLMSLVRRESKSVILRGIVEDWANMAPSEAYLISCIIGYCMNVWVVHYKDTRPGASNKRNLSKFLKEISQDLMSRKLSESVIENITEGIKKQIEDEEENSKENE